MITKEKKLDCKVIAITSFVNEENKKKCFKVGMVEVIHKPVDFALLKKVFNQYYYSW